MVDMLSFDRIKERLKSDQSSGSVQCLTGVISGAVKYLCSQLRAMQSNDKQFKWKENYLKNDKKSGTVG